MNARNPHEVLGVSPTASGEEIKSAWRKLAKKFHPDARPGDPEQARRFQEVQAAYDALRKPRPRAPRRRAETSAGFEPGFAKGNNTAASDTAQRQADNDFLSELFGTVKKAGARAFRQRGQDVVYTLDIPFREAARGTTRRVTLESGRTLDVRIPAGVDDGRVIRLKGQGEPGFAGGEAGDALITLNVAADPLFRREGYDIHLDLLVTVNEAVQGARLTVPTLDGRVTLAVPPGSNTGTRLRLKGKGLAPAKGAPGDQYVTLMVTLPEDSDGAFADLVRSWAKSHDGNGETLRRRAFAEPEKG
jgi:DnaJ-class molecular chaperone